MGLALNPILQPFAHVAHGGSPFEATPVFYLPSDINNQEIVGFPRGKRVIGGRGASVASWERDYGYDWQIFVLGNVISATDEAFPRGLGVFSATEETIAGAGRAIAAADEALPTGKGGIAAENAGQREVVAKVARRE